MHPNMHQMKHRMMRFHVTVKVVDNCNTRVMVSLNF
jgi:hypothetical protein